ncbi:hypothetical protein PB01_19440 [Psychrobacillus glaciei]|uniref:Uncharacterized protein n=1 Tax=Psychrobacillus glaciei TaxID=2283160 RepID=A0A5J6STF3_9BACI|nr:hypothetical protein PB01_19440 [Psychrobacillus glaciei]
MSNEYKRILLITNESNYEESAIIDVIKNIEKPQYIDELWISFNRYEELWNEVTEDVEEGKIVDVEYILIC